MSGRNKRTPKVVLDRRIHEIASMLAAGARRAHVLQTVADLQHEEARARGEAKRHNALFDLLPEAEQKQRLRSPDVELVWGDEEIPERTVDRYIQLAKELIVAELEDTIEDRARLFGKMLARGEQLYAAAFAARKFHACHQVWRTTLELFQLKEVAAMLVPPDGEEDGTIGGDGKPRLPMVEVVSDGPQLPSERRKQLLEQIAQGAKDAIATPPGTSGGTKK